jgi:hypothetical protein
VTTTIVVVGAALVEVVVLSTDSPEDEQAFTVNVITSTIAIAAGRFLLHKKRGIPIETLIGHRYTI